jgi:hemerythrin
MSATWSPELTLDHAELDRQHAELFRLVEAAAAAADQDTRVEAERAVQRFSDALLEHISAEDAVMDETLYPERGRHKLAHELFTRDFMQLREELREKGPTPVVVAWLRTRIPEWLRFHILANDVPLATHLATRGASHRAQRRGLARRLS